MLRNWRTFVLPAFVTLALATPPAPAGEAAKDRIKPLQEKLDQLDEMMRKDFRQAAADMKSLKEDIKSIREERLEWHLKLQRQLADLKTDVDALKRRSPADVALYPSTDKAGMEEIRSKLAQIERTLSLLQAQQTRVSLSPPTGPTSRTGRVLLVNTSATEMLFVVNGQPRRVAPGDTVALERVPAGAVAYEAIADPWGVVRSNTTSLAADETLTLVAR